MNNFHSLFHYRVLEKEEDVKEVLCFRKGTTVEELLRFVGLVKTWANAFTYMTVYG